jgi:hypothetical protein
LFRKQVGQAVHAKDPFFILPLPFGRTAPSDDGAAVFYKAQFRDGSDLPVSLRAQPPQLLQALQAPQQAQLPPQALFPAFLSRIMLRISSTTIAATNAIRTMLIRLAESQLSMVSLPL